MSIEFFNNERARIDTPYVTVDAQGRIYLNSDAQKLIGCYGKAIRLYVGYDPVNFRLVLAKPDIVKLADVNPFKFSESRSYASAKSFLQKYEIMPKAKAVRYVFDGMDESVKGSYLFRKEGAAANDQPKVPAARRGRPPKSDKNEEKGA